MGWVTRVHPTWMWWAPAALQQRPCDLPSHRTRSAQGPLGVAFAGLGWGWGFWLAWVLYGLVHQANMFAGWVKSVALYCVRTELRFWSLKYPQLYIN